MNLWRQLRDSAVALGSYWLATLFGLAAFSVSVLWWDHTAEDLAILGVIAAATVFGAGLGQVMGFFRLRPWIVWLLMTLVLTAIILIAIYVPHPDLQAYMIMFLIIGPIAFTSGIWTMRAWGQLPAAWLPLLLAIGAVLVVAHETGDAGRWFEGNKWAVWSIPTLGVLYVIILLMLVYLVAQQAYTLSRWRTEGSAPDRREVRVTGAPRVRLSLAGWAVVLMMSLALTVVTALVSPYLWRSAPAEDGNGGQGYEGDGSTDGGGGSSGGGGHSHGDGETCPHCGGSLDGGGGSGGGSGGSGGGGGSGGDGGGSGGGGGGSGGGGGGSGGGGGGSGGGGGGSGGGSGGCDGSSCPHCDEPLDQQQSRSDEMKEKASNAFGVLFYLAMLLFFMTLLALLAAILYRPMRRAVLMHHFRDPLFPVAPSAQIFNLWNLVTVALADAGFHSHPWEPAPTVAARAASEMGGRLGDDVLEMSRAAEIYRRAAFGLGVGDEDVARMRAAVACVTEAVDRHLDSGERFRALFRRI